MQICGNMKKILLITAIFVFLSSCSSKPSKDEVLLEEKIKRIENGLQPNLQINGDSVPNYRIEDRLKELGIPGVSIAVLNNGQLEWAKGYGFADLSENRLVTHETMFLAGSVSKPVAAFRAHQLAEEGIIHLDSNVNKYLSSWKVPDNEFTANQKVTTKRILNHTAGLTVWGFPGYDKGDTIPSLPEVLDGKGNTDAVRVYKEPGESWMYSGGGYTIMQLMITDIDKKSFPELMEEHVLNPLGMTFSTFENPLPEKYHALAATGYREDGSEVEGKWPIYPEMAAAGLWTTPSELLRYVQEIQKVYQTQQNGLLKVQTVNKMLTSGMKNHGLGLVVNEHTFEHTGADEGFKANLVAWKEHPVAVVILVNSDNGSIVQEILLSIAKEYKLPGIEPMVRTLRIKSIEEREPLVGTYHFAQLGEANVTINEKGLQMEGAFAEEPIILLPETNTMYFDRENGIYFTFVVEDGTATEIRFLDFVGKKTG